MRKFLHGKVPKHSQKFNRDSHDNILHTIYTDHTVQPSKCRSDKTFPLFIGPRQITICEGFIGHSDEIKALKG